MAAVPEAAGMESKAVSVGRVIPLAINLAAALAVSGSDWRPRQEQPQT